MKTRIEKDSVGTYEVPKDAYYGIQSLRALNNFKITNKKIHPLLIESIAEIKKAAAMTNRDSKKLNINKSIAIINACDEIISGKFHDSFIVDPIQGGAGTSTNMNANEVISNRAIELLSGNKGDYSIINPNDDVNMSQSTNDVYPTAGKMTCLKLIEKLEKSLDNLYHSFIDKSVEFNDVIKMGRTQLQDAVPIRLGQSFHAYSECIKRDIKRINMIKDEIRIVNMGATAVGTSINTTKYYRDNIIKNLNKVSRLNLTIAYDLIDATQNLDSFVHLSGVIKTCAVNLSKISNDIRLLSSGPKAGLNEINIPAKQNGSSIMPGKINPVIPEVVNQVAFNIIGNDTAVTLASEAGQLELNAFEPVLFYNIFESIETLTNAVITFNQNCIKGITANEKHLKELVYQSIGIITALNPYIGYKKSSEIALYSLKNNVPIKELILRNGLMTKEKLEEVLNPIKMTEAI